jgi:hypothetical protein
MSKARFRAPPGTVVEINGQAFELVFGAVVVPVDAMPARHQPLEPAPHDSDGASLGMFDAITGSSLAEVRAYYRQKLARLGIAP